MAAEVVAVGMAGALVGIVVAGSVTRSVGPFEVDMALRPALGGSTVVAVPPLGELALDTHAGPVQLDVRVAQLREDAARAIVADPSALQDLGRDVARDVRSGLVALLLRTMAVTALGSALLGWLVFRVPRRTAVASAAGLSMLALAGAFSTATFDREALAEPRFSGLLGVAPTAVGDVQDVVDRFGAYSLQLGRLVTNVSKLYAATSSLPTFRADADTIRLLHISDLHLNPAGLDVVTSVVEQFDIDVIVDTGDLTDFGSAAEQQFAERIGRLEVPYVYARGNHDSRAVQEAVRRQANAVVLDSPQPVEVAGLTFLGAGDPRFTPDKRTQDDDAPREVLEEVGTRLADAVRLGGQPPPDVVVVHDPVVAGPLRGVVPLVLAGHRHQRSAEEQEGTLLLVQGSTGGAGLRALEGEAPTPIMLSVLYLDRATQRLQAADDITLGGLGTSDARISRRVWAERLPAPVPVRPTPSP